MTDSPHATVTNPEQAHTTRSRLLLIGVYVPVAIAVLASVLFASWLPQLPSPAAVHWGADGTPDGFGSPWTLVLLPTGIILALCVFAAIELRRSDRPSGLPSFNQKFMASIAIWLAVFLVVGMGGSIWIQRGLSDAADAEGAGVWLLVGAIVGLLLAVLSWFALPRLDREGPGALPVAELPIAPSERVFWTGVVSMNRGVLMVVLGVLVLSLGTAIVAAVTGTAALALSLVVTAVIVILVCTTLRWRVTAGSHGVSVVSVAGWPAVRVPIADITGVRLIEVNPVADFGGWGWRWSTGRTGIIMQAGPAIELARRDKRALVIPVDDAASAVAILQAALRNAPSTHP